MVGGVLHLAHQVAGDEHGAPLVGQRAQQFPHPADALGVQAVDRLVEQQDVGVAEQRGRDAEPLAPCRARSRAPGRRRRTPGRPARSPRPPARRAAGCSARGRAGARYGGPAGMPGARVDQRAHPAHRAAVSSRYGRPSTVAVPAVGRVRPRTQRIVVVLPEPLGPRKPVTRPGRIVTRQVVDGDAGAVPLGQARELDHRAAAWRPARSRCARRAPHGSASAAARSCWRSSLLRTSRRKVTTPQAADHVEQRGVPEPGQPVARSRTARPACSAPKMISESRIEWNSDEPGEQERRRRPPPTIFAGLGRRCRAACGSSG